MTAPGHEDDCSNESHIGSFQLCDFFLGLPSAFSLFRFLSLLVSVTSAMHVCTDRLTRLNDA
ncbi:hypothetical protein T265_09492 [Opisthorchis viverrini]|uniref:Uncharacterized protein n=1 Tax=Opisthorchis viverrini TaxID=6198 RepID=A0A075A4S0_OPIVI|nr:hypothetical protein T265_09492 [Opisthorchis viverrini]KER22414.1 hypothetical protein T265_09492 [Opisthorchis viverrini]